MRATFDTLCLFDWMKFASQGIRARCSPSPNFREIYVVPSMMLKGNAQHYQGDCILSPGVMVKTIFGLCCLIVWSSSRI
jgi:hypothetical protein